MPAGLWSSLIIAVAVLAVGYLLGALAPHLDQGDATASSRLRDGLILGITLVLTVYLMLISVLATQLFDPKLADLSVPRARLEQSLSKAITKDAPQSLKQFSGAIIVEPGDMTAFLETIRANSGLPEYVKRLEDQLKLYEGTLKNQPAIFVAKATEQADFIKQQFDIENHDHFGLRQAQGHVDALIVYFQKWLSNWTATAKKCREAISGEQSQFLIFIDRIKTAIKTPDGKGDFPKWPDVSHGATLSPNCDFDSALSNVDVPKRELVDQSLGPIGNVAGWLLRTESRDIALMTGLLGFGLFGALSASFIRPSTNGNRLTSAVFIRGISAAILVYLAVVGGLTVFSREAIPNPYAVYFACLVAAVFSEDVWKWAEQRQQASFAGKQQGPRKARGPAAGDGEAAGARPAAAAAGQPPTG